MSGTVSLPAGWRILVEPEEVCISGRLDGVREVCSSDSGSGDSFSEFGFGHMPSSGDRKLAKRNFKMGLGLKGFKGHKVGGDEL